MLLRPRFSTDATFAIDPSHRFVYKYGKAAASMPYAPVYHPTVPRKMTYDRHEIMPMTERTDAYARLGSVCDVTGRGSELRR